MGRGSNNLWGSKKSRKLHKFNREDQFFPKKLDVSPFNKYTRLLDMCRFSLSLMEENSDAILVEFLAYTLAKEGRPNLSKLFAFLTMLFGFTFPTPCLLISGFSIIIMRAAKISKGSRWFSLYNGSLGTPLLSFGDLRVVFLYTVGQNMSSL